MRKPQARRVPIHAAKQNWLKSCASSSVCARRKERGSAVVEFAICVIFFWVPLFLGLGQFGFELVQATQVTEVCRDAGRMYAYGIDFSQSSNQYLLASFAPSLNIDASGVAGSSVAILSTVEYISTANCQAGGYTSTCPNYGKIVFTNQEVVGNSSLHSSAYGTPATGTGGAVAAGTPSTSGYLNQSSAVVTGFPGITLSTASTGQQIAYISELYSQSFGPNWFSQGTKWINSVSFF